MLSGLAFTEARTLPGVPAPLDKETRVSFKVKNFSDEGSTMILSYETLPEVPSIDPKTVQLKAVKRPDVNEQNHHQILFDRHN